MIKIIGFRLISKNYYDFKRGIELHGDKYEVISDFDVNGHYPADCYYQTNLLKPKFLHKRLDEQGVKYLYIQNSQKPFLVSESEPFREHKGWLRFGWNGYGWEDANCNNNNVGPERWNAFESKTGIKIKDWHSPGDNIVIMGQKEGDSALVRLYDQGYKSFYDWVEDIISKIRRYTDRPIIIRPHPRGLDRGLKHVNSIINSGKYKNVSLTENVKRGGNQGGESLDTDIANAHCVVTFNSLSAVEAVTRGVPVFALDKGSMVWPVAHKDFSKIENLNYDIDLQDWKNKIAYTFWNKQEVKRGEMWAHLRPVYFS